MSRSRRKSPFAGLCARTEKEYKRFANRSKRKAVKRSVQRGDEVSPHDKQFGNPWSGPKDGRLRITNQTKRNMSK